MNCSCNITVSHNVSIHATIRVHCDVAYGRTQTYLILYNIDSSGYGYADGYAMGMGMAMLCLYGYGYAFAMAMTVLYSIAIAYP